MWSIMSNPTYLSQSWNSSMELRQFDETTVDLVSPLIKWELSVRSQWRHVGAVKQAIHGLWYWDGENSLHEAIVAAEKLMQWTMMFIIMPNLYQSCFINLPNFDWRQTSVASMWNTSKCLHAWLGHAGPHTLVVWRGNFAGEFHWFQKLWQGCVTEKCRKWLWYDLSRDHSAVWFCKFLLLTHSCQYNIMSASLHSSVPLNICLIPWFQFMQKTTIMD